jgi:hypothetical protein
MRATGCIPVSARRYPVSPGKPASSRAGSRGLEANFGGFARLLGVARRNGNGPRATPVQEAVVTYN